MIKYKQLCGELEGYDNDEGGGGDEGDNSYAAMFELGSKMDSSRSGSLPNGSSYFRDDESSQYSLESHKYNNNNRGQINTARSQLNNEKKPVHEHHSNMYSNYNSNIYSIVSSEKINVYNNEVLSVACGAHLHWHISHVNDRYRRERAEGEPLGIGGGAEGAGIPPEYHQFFRQLEMGLPHKVLVVIAIVMMMMMMMMMIIIIII
jgi:hypothetical protein